MHDLVPLHHLATGKTAEVVHLGGHPEHVRRLEEIGLRSGTTVEMLQKGSPCIVRLASSKVCFRQNEAFSVLVRPGRAV
ncbi:MAG: ferrous iron transport protein A [Pirellulales bacterium]